MEATVLYLSFAKLRKVFNFIFFTTLLILMMSMFITILFPINYRVYIEKYSSEYNIDPMLISAIINVESGFNIDAISNKGAMGLMQIMPNTGKWAAENLDYPNFNSDMLRLPEINIQMGTWYLNQLNSEFEGDLNLILAAYNAGSGNVNKWLVNEEYSYDGKTLNKIPFNETEKYLDKVKINYKVYNFLYEPYLGKNEGISSSFTDVMIRLKIYTSEKIKELLR